MYQRMTWFLASLQVMLNQAEPHFTLPSTSWRVGTEPGEGGGREARAARLKGGWLQVQRGSGTPGQVHSTAGRWISPSPSS